MVQTDLKVMALSNPDYILGTIQFGSLRLRRNESSTLNITPNDPAGGKISGSFLTPFTTHIGFGATPNNVIYAGYEDVFHLSIPFNTTPSSTHWQKISNGELGAGNCTHIAVAPSNPKLCLCIQRQSTL